MRLNGLGLGQRVVVIVGLGAALLLVGDFVTNLGEVAYGWTAYVPLQAATVRGAGGLPQWAQLLVWLALVIVWVASSLRILQRSERAGGDGNSTSS